MVQLAAMLASWVGQRGRLSTPRLRLVVACGAAAGIAAVYNVTIAGALFVAEILLGSIAMESLGPLLVAALASSLISRYWGGSGGVLQQSGVQIGVALGTYSLFRHGSIAGCCCARLCPVAAQER